MKIGITLSGGLAKGAYQFGFLKALLTVIPKEDIEIVSSSSSGVINAYALCADKMEEVEKIWRTIDYDNIFEAMKDCWFHHALTNTFKSLVKPEDEVKIPFYATITYCPILLIGRYYLIEGAFHKNWIKFFRASVGFPIVTGFPHFYKGLLTMDGGACDNIPIYPLMEKHKLDLIICIHFDSKYILRKAWRKSKTIVVDLDCSLGNDLRNDSFNFSTLILNKMLDAGYDYGIQVCKKLFEHGYGNLEGIRKSADELYQTEFDQRMREGTIDRLVTTLNAFVQVFRGHHNIKPLISAKKRAKEEKKNAKKHNK